MCYGDIWKVLNHEFNMSLIPIFILIKNIIKVRIKLKE